MKRILAMILALMMVLSLTACGGFDAPAEEPAPAPEADAPAADAPAEEAPAAKTDKLVVYSPWSDVELEASWIDPRYYSCLSIRADFHCFIMISTID